MNLSRTDGKRPDGLTQIPWSSGKCATWDVTVTDTLAISNIRSTTETAGAAAELAARRKLEKYSALSQSYLVVPVAFETLGPVNESGSDFIHEIGKRLTAASGDKREGAFLWQRLSITLQRFNSICLRNSFSCNSFSCNSLSSS